MPIVANITARVAAPRPAAPAYQPKLMESTHTPGLVVLFVTPTGKGYVIFSGTSRKYREGDSNVNTGKNFIVSHFRPFAGVRFMTAPVARPAAVPAAVNTANLDYPFLAESDRRTGLIVFVTGMGRDTKSVAGTVLVNSNRVKGDAVPGYTSRAWKASRLHRFNGEITLRG